MCKLRLKQYKAICVERNFYAKGAYRTAYRDPATGNIIKYLNEGKSELNYYSHENWAEVLIWRKVKRNKKIGKYFLPVLSYSKCFTYVEYPFCPDVDPELLDGAFKVPKDWNDAHTDQFGTYNDNFVIRDYGDIKLNDNLFDLEKGWEWWTY